MAAALEGRYSDLNTGMALVTPNPEFAGRDLPLTWLSPAPRFPRRTASQRSNQIPILAPKGAPPYGLKATAFVDAGSVFRYSGSTASLRFSAGGF